METLKIPLGNSYIVQGDTIPKITFQFDPTDDIDLTLLGTIIKMQVYNNNIKFIDISNTTDGITVIDDKTFEIDSVDESDNDFPVGTFMGDLEITNNYTRFTYFRVAYTILKQYTK